MGLKGEKAVVAIFDVASFFSDKRTKWAIAMPENDYVIVASFLRQACKRLIMSEMG